MFACTSTELSVHLFLVNGTVEQRTASHSQPEQALPWRENSHSAREINITTLVITLHSAMIICLLPLTN